MTKRKPIHIVVATDSNYLVHAGTLLQSIASNSEGSTLVHVLAFKLTDRDKECLNTISHLIQCVFYDVNDKTIEKRLFAGSQINGDRSLAAFSRLLIPELLPNDISRCFYMDVDAVVLGNLNEIYSTNLDGYAIAGVLDTNPIKRHYAVGLDDQDNYINTGMILWNLDYCRSNNVVDRFARFITEHNGNVDAMDQGTINGVLSKEIKVLHPRANVLTSFFQMNSNIIKEMYGVRTYSDAEIAEAVTHPVFVHFTPNFVSRPWIKGCRHPLTHRYWQYRRMIDPNGQAQTDCRSLKIKLLSSLFYALPWPLYKILLSIR